MHGSLLILVGILIQVQGFAQAPSTEVKETLKKLGAVNQAGPQCTTPEGLQYVCEDMAKLACTPGEYSDGTGTSYSTEVVNERNEELRKKARVVYEAKLNTVLNTDNASYNQIRTLSRVATRQNLRPECISKAAADQLECNKQVAKILATQFAKSDFTTRRKPSDASESPLDFETLNALQSNIVFNQAIDDARKAIYQSVEQKAKTQRIEKEVFPRIRSMLVQKIKSFVKDEKTRQMMIDKVNNIAFKGGECGLYGSGEKSVSSLLVSNAYYSSSTQEFRYCNGLLTESDSEFMLVSVITHELTHSIDPCSISKPRGAGLDYSKPDNLAQCEKEYPFENVVQCLRTKESVGAGRSEWTIGPEEKAKREEFKVVRDDKDYVPPAAFCNGDQIGESVSDWMAAEILPDYIQKFYPKLSVRQKLIGYSNIFRPLCNKSGSDGPDRFDVHPETKGRINRIFMANRKIRHEIGCVESEKTPVYCQPGKPVKGTSIQAEMEAKAAEDEKKNKNACVGCGVGGMGGYPPGMPYPMPNGGQSPQLPVPQQKPSVPPPPSTPSKLESSKGESVR